jgi:GNAT superfamily N-acetyltransferase
VSGAPYSVSDDPALLDLGFVSSALASTYWAKGRSLEAVEQSVRASVCFGAYEAATGRQVGFARAVTDGATFTWVCDVVVDPAHRGRGIGKLLMAAVVSHPRTKATKMVLGTLDAHGLYEKFGFIRAEMMRRPAPG